MKNNMEYGGWGLSIDIEGFSTRYEYSEQMKTTTIMALNELMSALIRIGEIVYPGSPENNYSERLFAHQFGDGFVITSDYYEKSADRCTAVAMVLMRHMMMKGFATKGAISVGDMSDIKGCYPDVIRNSENGNIHLGMGLMTTIPVMGTALTRSHKLLSKVSGNVLILDGSRFECVPEAVVLSDSQNVLKIDWLSDEFTLAREIAEAASLQFGDKATLRKKFDWYIKQEPSPPSSWIESTIELWN